jgi:hypothetical protein
MVKPNGRVIRALRVANRKSGKAELRKMPVADHNEASDGLIHRAEQALSALHHLHRAGTRPARIAEY